MALDEPRSTFIDLRLANGLDPKKHFTQQKQISLIGAGQPFTLADIATSKFEAYDSLARVYLLFTMLTHDPKLAEFSFLLNYPKLKPEEQREKYSKFACHELNVFLADKDPKFFNAVVKPYLAKFNEQYHRSLREFSYQRSLTDDDLMVVTYDLLLCRTASRNRWRRSLA